MYQGNENITICDHPLIQHKLSVIRDKNTGTNEFRGIVEEIAMLIAYEALRGLPLKEIEIETPIEKAMLPTLKGPKPAIIPILRAGLGMLSGVLRLLPMAKVGHIGIYRDEKTFEPHEYLCKLPTEMEKRAIFVVDPMLATGGSAIEAINSVKKHGGKNISFLCIVGVPVGLERLAKAHPDVKIYVGNLDRCLNDAAYICPGLGDAGDRIFGT